MKDELPAALPLIALIAGLLAGPLLVNPYTTIAVLALLLCPLPLGEGGAQRRVRGVLVFAITGIVLSLHVQHREQNEQKTFATFPDSRFVTVVANVDRDWSPRGSSHVLRVHRFTANGHEFDAPLGIWTRFDPPPIAMESRVHAEGFLRRTERGDYALSVKSPRLLSYDGRITGPPAWNRALSLRLRPHAARRPVEVALVEALVLGRGERLDEEVRESFKSGGTYHLLVFSGLQIALAAAVLAAALRWLGAARTSDWLLLAFAAAGAPLFIGPTPSVSRVAVGIGLYALSRIAKRPTSLQNLWCVAALVRLIAEPRDLAEPSFQLTYAGAGALLFLATAAKRGLRWLARAAAAEVTIAPLTLFHFHQFALGGSLLTLAMSPLIFSMLVLAAAACALPCEPLFAAIGALHRICASMNVAAFSGFFAAPPLWSMVAGFGLALLGLLLRQNRRAIAMTLALLVPSVASVAQFASRRAVADPTVTFLDVGQGDAIAVRSGIQTMLVDGGGRMDDTSFGERELVPMLLDRGIRTIDVVVLSHAHPDHCGGLPAVLERLRVRELWISPRRFRGDCATRLREAARVTDTPIRLVRSGDYPALGEVRIIVHTADRYFRRAADNNASVMLHLRAHKRTILLTGDVERDAEMHFSDLPIRADVLKVAHHGSRTSTTRPFLDAVQPRVAVVSCGRRNLFGHPHPSVLEELSRRRIRTWRTDRDGTVEAVIRGGRIFVSGELQ